MKRFFQSAIGKTILFVGLNISLALVFICVAASWTMVECDVYTKTEEEMLKERFDSRIYSDVYDFCWSYLVNHQEYLLPDYLELKVTDENGTVVYQSPTEAEAETNQEYRTISYPLHVIVDGTGDSEITDIWYEEPGYYTEAWSENQEQVLLYQAKAMVNNALYMNESEAILYQLIHMLYLLRYLVYPIGVAAVLAAVFLFVTLMCVAGRRPDSPELIPGPLFRIPYDVLFLAGLSIWLASAGILLYAFDNSYLIVVSVAFLALWGLNLGLGLAMSLAARVKMHCLVSGSLLYKCIRFLLKLCKKCWRLIVRLMRGFLYWMRKLPLVWRTVLLVGGIVFLEIFFISANGSDPENLVWGWMAERIILIPLMLLFAMILRELQHAGEAIAAGDLSYRPNKRLLFWDFKKHAENLNRISEGMSQAVEERLKSERMKTELITNVSHDIKTPLTSIINYADLISKEQTDNPVIQEYSEVLLRQSEKLKRLIEDLIEASKASTGNLEVNPIPLDPALFISQADGEYEEKLSRAGLTLVTKIPEKEMKIMADSRRMWRVFDNLMNNICKYSQYGTRVYLTLEEQADMAVITFKNTSREELDISPEELMERFVRGDSSRNTDGNGLGLSIARSLTELQKGKMDLYVDGDLFKVVLQFPVLK